MLPIDISPAELSMLGLFSISILTRYAINYKETKPLAAITAERELNPSLLIDLAAAPTMSVAHNVSRFSQYRVPVLIDYLQKSNEDYLQNTLPEIERLIKSLLQDKSISSPYRKGLKNQFALVKKAISDNAKEANEKLFPYALKVFALSNGIKLEDDSLIELNLNDYEVNDQNCKETLNHLGQLLRHFPTTEKSEAFKRQFEQKVNYFQQDFDIHNLIEDQVLMGQIEELERWV